MKKVVRYLLEGDGSVPVFVNDGGYFSVGEELVGVSVDEDVRHVPATVVRMTKQQLIDRFTSLVPRDTLTGEPLTTEQIAAYIQSWLEERGMGDYA